jgi:glutamate-1-semialdehyde aminotransferase
MSWMAKWPGDFPVFVAEASGAHFVDVDGAEYVDFCLGDTGAMAGHSPRAMVDAVSAGLPRGITTMLPSADSVTVATELAARFGLPSWQFTLSAHRRQPARDPLCPSADRARARSWSTDYCYHGTVDETFATLDPSGSTVSRRSNIGPPIDVAETTIAVEFNDLAALDAALATGEGRGDPDRAGADPTSASCCPIPATTAPSDRWPLGTARC